MRQLGWYHTERRGCAGCCCSVPASPLLPKSRGARGEQGCPFRLPKPFSLHPSLQRFLASMKDCVIPNSALLSHQGNDIPRVQNPTCNCNATAVTAAAEVCITATPGSSVISRSLPLRLRHNCPARPGLPRDPLPKRRLNQVNVCAEHLPASRPCACPRSATGSRAAPDIRGLPRRRCRLPRTRRG